MSFAIGVVLLSAVQLSYRFTLPTDGWIMLFSDSLDQPNWVYLANLVGAPSEITRDDQIIAVAGQALQGRAGSEPLTAPIAWEAGRTVSIQVLRQGQLIDVTVPVVHWTPAALLRGLFVRLEYLVGLLGGALLFALTLYVHWRRPDIPAVHPLLLLASAFLAIQLSHLLPDGLSAQFNSLALYSHGIFGSLLFVILLGPSLFAFMLLFPRPNRLVQRFPWIGVAPFGLGLLLGALLITGAAPSVGWLGTIGMLLASLASLVYGAVTQRDDVSRAQFRWAVSGLLGGILLMFMVYPAASGMVTDPVLAQWMGSGFQLGFTLIGVTLSVAVQRHRLFDIELIVNRALVYGILTAGVIGVYVAVVGYLGWLFQSEANLVLSLVATGVVAVGFAPARQLVQRAVNRLLYGERDEPYRVLSRLGQQLEIAAAPSAVLTRATSTLAHSLKLPYVAVVHRDGGVDRLLAAAGRPSGKTAQVPLTYAGASVGALVIGPREPDGELSRADMHLLADVARPLSVVAHAAALQNRLEEARLRLVAERGEARLRLGSDLHDRIGHQVTAVTRQVERTGRVLASNPGAANVLLDEIAQQLRHITEQVRGLAHELFPPELALLGLESALRERALTATHLPIQIVVPEPLPDLPAEVEAALYSIALEALTNVDRHAQASHCTIQLQVIEGAWPGSTQIELLVRDNGMGIAPTPNQGMGLLSMQARAAEVGGECQFRGIPGQGTQIQVRIPFQCNRGCNHE